MLHCTGNAHRRPNAPEGVVFLSPPRLFKRLANIPTSKLEVADDRTVANIPNDSVKAPSLAMDRTIKSNATHSHTSLFPMSNLMLQIGSVTTMVLP